MTLNLPLKIENADQFRRVVRSIQETQRLIDNAHDDFEFDREVGENVFRPKSYFVARYAPHLEKLTAAVRDYMPL